MKGRHASEEEIRQVEKDLELGFPLTMTVERDEYEALVAIAKAAERDAMDAAIAADFGVSEWEAFVPPKTAEALAVWRERKKQR